MPLLPFINSLYAAVAEPIDETLEGWRPSTMLLATLALMLALEAKNKYDQFDRKRSTYYALSQALKIPVLGKLILDEIGKETKGFDHDVDKSREGMEILTEIPENGWSEEDVFKYLGDVEESKEGQDSGCIYAVRDKEEAEFLGKIFALTERTNPMHSEKWPRIKLLEAQINAMCQNLFHGDEKGYGIITPGGSYSIIEATHAYVSHLRKHEGISEPVIIIPESAHAAFFKAAEITGAKLVVIPVNPATGAVDLKQMEAALKRHGKKVAMMVGSAPSFPYGVFDPIEAMGQLALKHKVPFHVDACLGGFLAAFCKRVLPLWDFRVPGVTSISADTHKFGAAAKGSSWLGFKKGVPYTTSHSLLDWMGGLYVTEGMAGSQPGHVLANVFSVLCRRGRKRYEKDTEEILTLKDQMVEGIRKIEGLHIPHDPQLSVITIEGEYGVNPLLVAEYLQRYHWAPNVVTSPVNDPGLMNWAKNLVGISARTTHGIHFCLTAVHVAYPDFANRFLVALESAVTYARENVGKKPHGTLKVYGTVGTGLVPDLVADEIGAAYSRSQNTVRRP